MVRCQSRPGGGLASYGSDDILVSEEDAMMSRRLTCCVCVDWRTCSIHSCVLLSSRFAAARQLLASGSASAGSVRYILEVRYYYW